MTTKKPTSTTLGLLLSVVVVMCMLGSAIGKVSADNYLVFKNDNVFALKLTLASETTLTSPQQSTRIRLTNTQQTITLQVPVHIESKHSHVTANHSQHLPITSSLLSTNGYIKPLHPFSPSQQQQFVKGYKYVKPAYHDSNVNEVYEEVQAFVKAIVVTNRLDYLKLRMEDQFEIEVGFESETQSYKVNSIKVKYLFATLSRSAVPESVMKLVNGNFHKHDAFLAKEKVGTLQRHLYGKGLHQWINHTITLTDETDIHLQPLWPHCYFQFTDILPESTYIDADQRRAQTTNYETINIEKPAFASQQYFYKYRVALKELEETGVDRYSYSQPVHFRYPAPSLLNYTKVYLHPIEEARIVCELPKAGAQKGSELLVYPLEENPLFERGTAKIPNADISKAKIVSIMTLAVCLMAALVIIKNLKKN